VALRIVANRPDPAILTLPWDTPLEEWAERPDSTVVPLPRGLSRHVVRIVRLRDRVYAVKETQEEIAFREYRVLRDLQRMQLPAVVPQAVVAGRPDDLPATLITQHLRFSLPYRALFEHGLASEQVPSLIDALVVLLVRLHLADFYWGDVSLSNVLFRRDAGGFAAYLVDAETGELRQSLSRQMREYDVTVGTENVYAELMDVIASGAGGGTRIDPEAVVERLQSRYEALWNELTAAETFSAEDSWRIEQRIERLNDLGFDVEEIDIVTDVDGDQMRLQPRVVELGHHARELQNLTGLVAEDAQARRLLNDIAAFTSSRDLGRLDREVVAQRWLREVWEPLQALVPQELRGKLEPAEIFHEVLVHRWFLSERAGRSVRLLDAARSYVDTVLTQKPEEALAAEPDL
jgi:tRNA A-37 threonylcarbamoyl transferase component Bud32